MGSELRFALLQPLSVSRVIPRQIRCTKLLALDQPNPPNRDIDHPFVLARVFSDAHGLLLGGSATISFNEVSSSNARTATTTRALPSTVFNAPPVRTRLLSLLASITRRGILRCPPFHRSIIIMPSGTSFPSAHQLAPALVVLL
ncbi:hypothetical protein LshimejAT787_0200850 [Lyophyllum shimeji]|uniref:Uncharacterized protein n=1 Tax=Lyophyllum shimeji TaxID=47721 RepID=A0A9P3PEI6_LYOSH|nr:hypothetical protein LshimejAT787_0200850 [Lyophyllum shimeji]